MNTENINLINVIKYLQEQYTLNERNRINYELLLKNKEIQRNKAEAAAGLTGSLAGLNLTQDSSATKQVQHVINESKQKLSSVLKDINILLSDQDSIKDVVYNRISEENSEKNSSSFAMVEKSRFTSNIPHLSTVLRVNDHTIVLLDYENGLIETRSLEEGKFTIKSQEKNELLKNASQCWYSHQSDSLLINDSRNDSILNLKDGKKVALNKKDLFFRFDSQCDFKDEKLLFLDGFDGELIRIVDVTKTKEFEVDLSKFSFYTSTQRILDLKFGITETSILVLTSDRLLIIDYTNSTLLTELALDVSKNGISSGLLTLNSNLSSLLLTFLKEDCTVTNHVYSLETFQIMAELTHTFNFLEGKVNQVLVVENSIFYLLDKQIQVRSKQGVLKHRYWIRDASVFSSMAVKDDILYYISQSGRGERVVVKLLAES